MPNILLTKICNLSCSYCFASNVNNRSQQKEQEISLELYIYYLKHLKINSINEVRLLWWEPLLHSKIKQILDISYRGWFRILIFSNLSFHSDYIFSIFWEFPISFFKSITVNINLNKQDFYTENQLLNIKKNILYLKSWWADIVISTILEYDIDFDYIFWFSRELGVKRVKFKPLNGKKFHQITSSRKYWKLAYNIIKKYNSEFQLSFSCWLSEHIFLLKELDNIKNKYKFYIKFWCYANEWKYDIDINWNIFRCFPLEKMYNEINIKEYYSYNSEDIIKRLKIIFSTENNTSNCLWKNV